MPRRLAPTLVLAPALVLAVALLPACTTQGPHTPRTGIAAPDAPETAVRKVDPDPEHVSTGGKVALGLAGAGAVAVVVAIVAVAVGSAALMSNMNGP